MVCRHIYRYEAEEIRKPVCERIGKRGGVQLGDLIGDFPCEGEVWRRWASAAIG